MVFKQTLVPVSFLVLAFFVISASFIVMIAWYVTQPLTIGFVNSIEGDVPSEGISSITILKTILNLWGPIAVAVALFFFGLVSVQRRDPRGYYD